MDIKSEIEKILEMNSFYDHDRGKQHADIINAIDQLYSLFDQYTRHLKKTYKNVIQVEKRKDGINYILRIVDVQSIPGEGLIIIVD